MLFWLKKVCGFWLMPLPFSMLLLGLGILLLWRKKTERWGRHLILAAFLLLLVLSNKAVSRFLLTPLEYQYPAIPELPVNGPLPETLAKCEFIIVLGGGHGETSSLAAFNRLSESAQSRLAEGVRLARALPSATLITCGPTDGVSEIHARVLARAARSLGVEGSRIRTIEEVRDTSDEAVASAKIVGKARVALVTSACHMPRAYALFKKQGIDVLACPTDFKSKPSPHFALGNYSWDIESLIRSSLAVRERLGLLWVTLRGQS